jgi:hypothetical protein
MNPYDQAIDWLYTDKTDFDTSGPISGDMRRFVKNGLDSVVFNTPH